MKRSGESSRGYLRRNLFRKYVLSMRRDKDIPVFAWISNGSSLPGWKLFLEGVVRCRGKGCPLFRSQSLLLPSVCISKATALIDDVHNRAAKITIITRLVFRARKTYHHARSVVYFILSTSTYTYISRVPHHNSQKKFVSIADLE